MRMTLLETFGLTWTSESDESISEDFLVLCGIIMGSAASFINCLGLNLQKQSLCDVLFRYSLCFSH